jgi:mannose-6-phosphate isomerase-like protein (cupin superfamily)
MTDAGVISIPVVAAATSRPFEPRDIATLNDSIVRLAVIDGETPWHHHRDDELFLCWEGGFRIEIDGGKVVDMRAGDLFVVRRGVEHKAAGGRTRRDDPRRGAGNETVRRRLTLRTNA